VDDNIDTAQIIPAEYVSLPPNLMMIAGENFGCGSSQEYPPLTFAYFR
jgi:3-isopropylmalate dehydratase small subunit